MAGEQKPNWWKRIDTAEATGGFVGEDRDDADDWLSCACGRLDPRIPRRPQTKAITPNGDESFAPVDETLFQLGVRFSFVVGADDYMGARQILEQIEEREGRLLAEIEDQRFQFPPRDIPYND